MLKIEAPSPMDNEDKWTIYMNQLETLDDINEEVIAERLRAQKILDMIQEDKDL